MRWGKCSDHENNDNKHVKCPWLPFRIRRGLTSWHVLGDQAVLGWQL